MPVLPALQWRPTKMPPRGQQPFTVWLHGFLSDLISSVSHHPLPPAALQSHQPQSFLNIPRSPQHLLSHSPSWVEPSHLPASCGVSSWMIRSQLNVPPQTDLLASVTSKPHWPLPAEVSFHHVAQLYVFQRARLYLVVHCLSLPLEQSSMRGDRELVYFTPSSISTYSNCRHRADAHSIFVG